VQQVGATPLPQAAVLHSTGVLAGDALRIAHQQGPDPMLKGEGDDLIGGLMVGLVDATSMPDLGPTNPEPVSFPAP
jgi:hypothetical protein